MARKTVIEITCDRCGKTEHVTDPSRAEKDPPDFSGSLFFDEDSNEEKEFQDLCGRCRKAVRNYWNKILLKDGESDDPPETGPPIEE